MIARMCIRVQCFSFFFILKNCSKDPIVLFYCWLFLVVLRINVDLAIFQPYLDLEAGDNQSLKIQVARPGIEPRSSCSASQELNHSVSATAALISIETVKLASSQHRFYFDVHKVCGKLARVDLHWVGGKHLFFSVNMD